MLENKYIFIFILFLKQQTNSSLSDRMQHVVALTHAAICLPSSTVPPSFYGLIMLHVMQLSSNEMRLQQYTSHLTLMTLLQLLSFVVVLLRTNSNSRIGEIVANFYFYSIHFVALCETSCTYLQLVLYFFRYSLNYSISLHLWSSLSPQSSLLEQIEINF